jgi:hypothetical protein
MNEVLIALNRKTLGYVQNFKLMHDGSLLELVAIMYDGTEFKVWEDTAATGKYPWLMARDKPE